MKYLLIFLFAPIQLFSQIWTDTIYFDDHALQYNGDWISLDYGKAADKTTSSSRLIYDFWGYGIDVYTYVDYRHGNYTISVNGIYTNVDITNDTREVRRTFSIRNLPYANHRILIIPQNDSTFVFKKFVKFVVISAYQPPCIDTLYSVSVKWTTEFIWIDSIRWIVKDSTIWNEKDTLIVHYKDSTVLHYDTLESRIDTFYVLPKKITFELN